MNGDKNNAVHVRAIFPGEPTRLPASILRCRIGTDVSLRPKALEDFCFKAITVREEELVFLAATVAFADRSARRRAATGWRRDMHVIMPVSEVRFWRQAELNSSLTEALRYLTGDAWSFEFVKRKGRLPKLKQAELQLGQGEFVVMPFSNGLDSFAQARLSRAEQPSHSAIRVTAWNRGLSGGRAWVSEADGSRYRRVAVPVKISVPGNADQTFRTRSFLFSVLAGLACHMADARAVIIPEAGQGAMGPSLVPVGAESPHRGSHPGFSRRMARFFQAFWSHPVVIEHPQLWRTKGQVLADLKGKGIERGWEATRSCSRDQRVLPIGRRKLIHCGICSGCLLRRLAVFSAGLTEPADQYMWSDLSAESLDKALCADARRKTRENDRDIAVHAIMAMEDLARQADQSGLSPRFESNLFDAFGDNTQQINAGAESLRQLLATHQKEWRAFTHELGARSWVNQQIAIL